MRGMKSSLALVCIMYVLSGSAHAQDSLSHTETMSFASDSSLNPIALPDSEPAAFHNAWGVDILISNGGFGLGMFYRREFSDEWYGFASLSVSESKDDREIEQFDYYTGTSFTPGKLNRFLVIPLMFGVQHRLFKDEITDNFRPYVNAGAGPTMIYVTPYTRITYTASGPQFEQVEFFNALGKGQPHYTVGGFIGFGANFGTEKANLFGVNFRYYFTYLVGDGLPSLFNANDGTVSNTKKDFGGFFITLNVGMAY
jgi:hypothetical protein